MVHAAAQKLINFSEARLMEPLWWRRTWVILGWLDRQLRGQAHEYSYQLQLALASNSGLTLDSFKNVQQRARELYYDVTGCLRPWEGRSWEDHKKNEFAAARDDYIAATGNDPHDEEFQAREATAIKALLAKDTEPDPEMQQEQVVADRFKAAEEARKRRRR